MAKTTSAYINDLSFAYFKTYSFQRTGDYEIYAALCDKKANTDGRLSNEDNALFNQLQKSVGHELYSTRILSHDGKLHYSAEQIAHFMAGSRPSERLIEIMQTPIEQEMLWLCAPAYRDAILFYNDENELVSGINICFQCDQIESIDRQKIKTDYKTFKYLKQLLLELGHKIERPNYFKADEIEEMAKKAKDKRGISEA